MLNKVHHIAIIVSNYEVSKDFYVNKLEFPNSQINWSSSVLIPSETAITIDDFFSSNIIEYKYNER